MGANLRSTEGRRGAVGPCALAVIGAAMLCGRAGAAVFNAGAVVLQPNKANQQVQFFTTGGDAITGFQLEIQTADGGPQVNGTVKAPKVSNVNLLAGTIFAGNNSGQSGIGALSTNAADTSSQAYESYVFTSSGSVVANGLLATVTFDTTGFSTAGQTFALRVRTATNDASRFYRTGTATDVITDGTITIAAVPEPTALAAVGGASIAMLRRRRR